MGYRETPVISLAPFAAHPSFVLCSQAPVYAPKDTAFLIPLLTGALGSGMGQPWLHGLPSGSYTGFIGELIPCGSGILDSKAP